MKNWSLLRQTLSAFDYSIRRATGGLEVRTLGVGLSYLFWVSAGSLARFQCMTWYELGVPKRLGVFDLDGSGLQAIERSGQT